MNRGILSFTVWALLNMWLAACFPQLSAAADSAPVDPAQAATARVKQDVSTFTEWNQDELSLPKYLVPLLAPLKLVELSPKERKQPKILVAVAADGKTYRFTNDPDLAAVIDITGLKSFLGRDVASFAQQLATLRSFPEDAKVIGSIGEISPGNEAVQKLRGTIAPPKITTNNEIITMTFCFFQQVGGAVFQMTVIAGEKAPTQMQTYFLGYAK